MAVQGCHCSGPPCCTFNVGRSTAFQGLSGGVFAPHMGAQESLPKEMLSNARVGRQRLCWPVWGRCGGCHQDEIGQAWEACSAVLGSPLKP